MKINLIIFLFAFLLLLTTAAPVAAQATPTPTSFCQEIYGGGPSCVQSPPLSINKQIQNPDTKAFVESLLTTDPTYSSGQTVVFKLTITNTGNENLSAITVRDIFPSPLTFSKGTGKYDTKTRTLQFTIDQLKGHEAKTFFIEGKVGVTDKTSNNQQPLCVINQVIASANNNSSQDNTSVCFALTQKTQKKNATPTPTLTPASQKSVSKGGLPIYPPSETKTTPETGPEALAVIGLNPAGAVGVWLRKKSMIQ